MELRYLHLYRKRRVYEIFEGTIRRRADFLKCNIVFVTLNIYGRLKKYIKQYIRELF